MTDQRAALVELIERVGKGDLYADYSLSSVRESIGWLIADAMPGMYEQTIDAYDGSVDDALSLLAHLLPGARMRISGPAFDGGWSCRVICDDMTATTRYATHPTLPSRALLLATLRAKLATRGEGEG